MKQLLLAIAFLSTFVLGHSLFAAEPRPNVVFVVIDNVDFSYMGKCFGGQPAIPKMRAAGWRALDPWMSLTGADYMDALEKRMIQLAASGVGYFKLDGVFGHLNARNFDIEGFKGGEEELNAAQYDEAKERYLSLGSERLMKIFSE